MNHRALLFLGCLFASTAGCLVTTEPSGGYVPPPVSGRLAYTTCNAGEACTNGTTCALAMYSTSGAPGNLCTAGCTNAAQCPPSSYFAAYAPTCVVSASTGTGLCYDSCVSDVDCGGGTACAMVPGTSVRICVPATGVGPSARLAYERCNAGEACTNGTTCATAMYSLSGAPGNLCTAGCTSAAQCPPSSYFAAYAPTCVVSASTGTGLCYDSCVSNADCGGGTVCAQVPGTTVRICVPGT